MEQTNETNETIIEAVEVVDNALETMESGTVSDAGTVETSGDGKKRKTIEYRQKSTIPANIDAMRAPLFQMAKDVICKLDADSVEPNTPDNLKIIAKMGHHGLGVGLETWLSGATLDKEGKPIQASFELTLSLRAIHPQSGARSGYSAKAKAEAAEVLMFEDYNTMLDAKMNDKEFKAKVKTRAMAQVKIPFAAWCKQKRANMTISDKNSDDVNAANKARLDAWNLRIDAKCKELADMETVSLDDVE